MTGRLTLDQLRRSTLRRQFPVTGGRGPEAVLELFDRLGPIQSQVPRAPFLAASSRLPGVSYGVLNGLFAEHRLVKASTLRGTVHTSTASSYPAVDAVARQTRAAPMARAFGPTVADPAAVIAEIERLCADRWVHRDEVVAHARTRWPGIAPAATTGADGYLWGHSGLLRRPPDGAWEKRTDVERRTAAALLGRGPEEDPDAALRDLVLRHLAAYGPVLRDDLVFFFGASIRSVNAALTVLGEQVVRLPGPDGLNYLDLADPPTDGLEDPGLRLLPEFDGLLLGYAGRNRHRFVDAAQLARIWAKINGMFSPVVLHEGRLVATWKSVGPATRTRVEVTMLDPYPLLRENQLDAAVADTAVALGLTVVDVDIRPCPR